MKTTDTRWGKLLDFHINDDKNHVIFILNSNKINGIQIADDIPNYRISSENLDFISSIRDCKTLIFNCISISDFSLIENLNCLENLMIISPVDNLDLGKLINLKSLTILNSRGKLNISNCANLEEIDIDGSNFLDFYFLKEMQNLKSLTFRNYAKKHFESINGIENAVCLENLNLYGCSKLKEIKKLNGLKKLKSVTLENCKKIQDFEDLYDLPSLEKIQLFGMGTINSIEFMSHFRKLKEVFIPMGTVIKDGNLMHLRKVKKVDIPWRPSHYYSNSISKWIKNSLNIKWNKSKSYFPPANW